MSKVISLDDLVQIVAKLPARMEKSVVLALQDTALQGVGIVVEEIKKVGATYTGDLAQSVRAQMTPKGAVIRVDAPHAAIVEYGRRPDRRPPPVGPIALWAARKLGLSQKEALRAGFAISRSIGKKGIKPKRYLERSMVKIRKLLDANIRRVLTAELSK